jgi:hypothetical protein
MFRQQDQKQQAYERTFLISNRNHWLPILRKQKREQTCSPQTRHIVGAYNTIKASIQSFAKNLMSGANDHDVEEQQRLFTGSNQKKDTENPCYISQN